METNLSNPLDPSANDADGLITPAPRSLRATGRPDTLTAQKVEVGIILQAMLGTPAAAEYLETNAIERSVALRVLFEPHLRRGHHDAYGIRC
ncbi:MAG: hypothetical protein JWR40_854 [Massilia sp.]|jgi:hypothetical protein|nr:hypothetical protein [Massilia sp.]MDB5951996.1 hypothetical protein [Massilia sp.]